MDTNSLQKDNDHLKNVYAPKISRVVLDAFSNLTTAQVEKQTSASLIILKYAYGHFHQIPAKEFGDEAKYIINRLVSGLGSGRECARQGFFTTLRVLLQQHQSPTSSVFQAITDKFSKRSHKEEARDMLLGEIFGYGALIRSGRACEDSDLCSQIIERLLVLRRKKSYTDILAAQFLINLMSMEKNNKAKNEIWKSLRSLLSNSVADLTPCQLWLRITFMSFSDQLQPSPPAWLHDTISHHHYTALVAVIMSTTEDLPQMHPVLNAAIEAVASNDDDSSAKLTKLWTVGIVPFFQAPSHNQKRLITIIAKLILPRLKEGHEIRGVLCEGLVKQLINAGTGTDRGLQADAKSLTGVLLKIVIDDKVKDTGLQSAVVLSLLKSPGCWRFDKISRSQIIQQSLEHLTARTVKDIVAILTPSISDGTYRKSECVSKGDHVFGCQWLSRLVCHPQMLAREHITWRSQQIVTLLVAGLFSPGHPRDLQAIREAFFKSLDQPCKRVDDYTFILKQVMSTANTKMEESSRNESKNGVTDYIKMRDSWIHMTKQLTLLTDSDKDTSLATEANNVFIVLYAHMGLQLFVDPENTKEVIDELDACYKNATLKKKKKSKRKSLMVQLDKSEIAEPAWVDVVVDLLVSLLSQAGHLWRSVAQAVFRMLCPLLTDAAVTTITDVLIPEKVSQVIDRGEEMVEQEENADGDGDDDDDDDDDDQTVSLEPPKEGESDDSSDDEDDLDESDNEANDDGDDDNIFEMRKKLFALVGAAEGDDSGDIDMDSVPQEQLAQLDKQLGAVLKEYIKRPNSNKVNKKKKLAKDETQLMHFRTRVCDLAEVMVAESFSMSQVLKLINPLLVALHAASKDKRQQPLHSRLLAIMVKLGGIKKFTSTGDMTMEQLIQVLDNLYETADKMSESVSGIVGGCCSMIVHCSVQLLGEEAHSTDNPIVAAYSKHLQCCFSRRDLHLSVRAFTGPISIDCGGLWHVSGMLLNSSFSQDMRLYCRTQALEIFRNLYINRAAMAHVSRSPRVQLEKQLSINSIEVLNSLRDAESVKVQYLSNLLDLLRFVKQYQLHVEKHKCGINWEDVGASLISFRQRVPLRAIKKVRTPLNRLFAILKLPQVSLKFDKTSEETKKVTKEKKKKKCPVREDDGDQDEEEEEEVTEENNNPTDEPTENKRKRKEENVLKMKELNKKKRKKDRMEQKKRSLGSQIINELEGFSFATSINIASEDEENETVNTSNGLISNGIDDLLDNNSSFIKKDKSKKSKNNSKDPTHKKIKKKKEKLAE